MKKLTTALATVALGVATAFAGPVANPGVAEGVKVTGVTPAFQVAKAQMKQEVVSGTEGFTRSFVNTDGSTYEARFQLAKQPLNELLTFEDKEGNPYHPSFDDMPYYLGNYTLTKTKPGEQDVTTIITFNLCWPSMYIYDQVWSWKGELDEDGAIPVALRDYTPVTMDMLANNSARCSKFQEAAYVGAADPEGGKWGFYTMLPNEQLGDPCLYDDNLGYTELSDTRASTLEFTMYDPEENWIEITNRIYVYIPTLDSSRRVQCNYKGEGDVEGFTAFTTDLPEFGDVHLFNTGIQSSDSWGDNNPFPGEFDPLTAFYIVTGDKYLLWNIDPIATNFDASAIVNGGLDLPAGETIRDHANFVKGYLFADAKFARDLYLNPETASFLMLQPELVHESDDFWYGYVVPQVNTMLPYGVGDMNGTVEPWADTYGLHVLIHNLNEMVYEPTTLGWGYKQGFVAELQNEYLRTFHVESTGKLFYHYDPNNMQVYRELSLVGGTEYNGVEEVAVAVENAAPVFYNLNGARVNGSNLAKGVYVKVTGSKAEKVLVK